MFAPGHSVVFNRRHRRSGDLFRNRYHAVLCEAGSHLLQVVRYVHCNPVWAARQQELRRELDRGRAEDLPALATKVARKHGVDFHALRGTTRNRRVSVARRALTWAAVERGIRPVKLSRYLGISRAAITAQLRTAAAQQLN